MKKPLLLWLDCTSKLEMPEVRRRAMELFDVACARLDDAPEAIARLKPRALCFDFDYPDQARLCTMQSIKRMNMQLPVLMLTVEHSEALAVWAFRMPVWNYVVKPVSVVELQENLQALRQIVATERRSGRAFCLKETAVPQGVPASRPDDPQIALLPAINLIEQHYNTRISAERVARACGLSRFAFSRLFHATYGLTFQDYLLRFRVFEACRLLENDNASITDVGCAVGFNDPSHFARVFRRYTGLRPSQYSRSQTRPSAASMHPSVLQGLPGGAMSRAPEASPEAPPLDQSA
jgi:AraC-like DNA-binding protein/CheY-like chemotaxis protein